MNFATIVFGAFVFFFLWRGYQKGFVGSITRIVSWLAAYPAAIYFTNPVAKFIFQHTSFDGMIVYFIAGSSIFLIVSLIVGILLNALSDTIPESTITENSSKVGGSIVGFFVGGIVGLLAVYAIDLTQKPEPVALQKDNNEPLYIPESSPPVNKSIDNDATKQQKNNTTIDSFIDTSAKKLVSTIAATAVDVTIKDPNTTSLTKAFAENPQAMLGHIQQLTNNGQIKALLADPTVQELLTNGDTNALLNNKEFRSLMHNEDMQAILANVEDNETGKTSEQVAAEKMTVAWGRANALRNDPQVIAILSDPEFQQQLNASNKLPLLTSPKLKMLTERIFANPQSNEVEQTKTKKINNTENSFLQPSIENPGEIDERREEKPEGNANPTIYRWTDENGKVHYSDSPTKT